jgi:hypothetical protein
MPSKKTLVSSLLFATCLLIASCDDSESESYQDPLLKEYINRFVDEGKLRGRVISVKKLTAKFEVIANNMCSYGRFGVTKIGVMRSCWDNLSELAKELLMFHELGHAMLGRDDLTDLLPNGDPKSIMTPDPTVVYNEITTKKREYYLDELFDAQTATPNWGFEKKNATLIFLDEIKPVNDWQFFVGNGAQDISSISTTVFASSPSSLSIKSAVSGTSFSYWAYAFRPSGIEEGNAIEVKVKIRGEALTGGGAYMAIRGDVAGKLMFFYTMQKTNPVIGTSDFSEYALKVTYFPSTLDWFYIFLILDGTSSGDVFFDDVQVTKFN